MYSYSCQEQSTTIYFIAQAWGSISLLALKMKLVFIWGRHVFEHDTAGADPESIKGGLLIIGGIFKPRPLCTLATPISR